MDVISNEQLSTLLDVIYYMETDDNVYSAETLLRTLVCEITEMNGLEDMIDSH
jgi:hypothetical protein